MRPIPVIAIFDIGKTNKKFFLVDETYAIVEEQSIRFDEIADEDGDMGEDIAALRQWLLQTLEEAIADTRYTIRAINFSTYGASLVYIDETGKPVAPLYNYLKKYPATVREKFYSVYGDEKQLSRETASPLLDSLNSGMQLYRLKEQQPAVFSSISYALHLPQYISYLVTGQPYSDITSIGCHTQLWDFDKQRYHDWVLKEGIDKKLAPVYPSDKTVDARFASYDLKAGIGLHDSSAALIPYLANFSEPFILISTGTWCISLNPFNAEPLTTEELDKDCLCYLGFKGKPVKASRLFAGHAHEQAIKALSAHFNKPENYYQHVTFNHELAATILQQDMASFTLITLDAYSSYEEAYHHCLYDIVQQQKVSTQLVAGTRGISRIFVDGGFSKNPLYMNWLAIAFPGKEVYAASVSQATAIGAALAIHAAWNTRPIAGDMIRMKLYHPSLTIVSGETGP